MRNVRLKRFAAALLALPLLHLNVARASIACDRHEVDATSAAASLQDAHTMHGSHGAGHASQDERPRGDTTPTECCQALAPCSFAFGAEHGQALPASVVVDDGRPASTGSAPRSRFRTPEPPPPKA